MTKREQAKFEKQMAARSVAIRAEHAELRARVLALRPAWSATVLESIVQSYGTVSDGSAAQGLPGLRDLVHFIERHDDIAARFGVQS